MGTHLTAHMIVKNEEQWVWYALKSVLEYVDKIVLFDTGSTDKTVSIINSLQSNKIEYYEKGEVTPKELVILRNEQIKKTKTNWFLLLDGDEIWPEETIKELLRTLSYASSKLAGIVVKAHIPVGDLEHFQEESAGKYHILGKVGHYNIRAYRKDASSRWEGVYPLEAYVNTYGITIQNRNKELKLLHHAYWHMTHLVRSAVDTHGRKKYEIGKKMKLNLPGVFYLDRPTIVPSPWVTFSSTEMLKAKFVTPLLKIKRKFT